MAEGGFKLRAHHVAFGVVIVLAAALVYQMTRPPRNPGGWQPGHKVDTFGLETDDEGTISNRSEMEGALELARAVLRGEKAERKRYGALTSFEGRRVWITAYGVEYPAPTGTGKGDDLFESVVAAAEDLRENGPKVKWKDKAPEDFRVRIDVVYKVYKKHLRPEVYLPPRESIGTWGILLADTGGDVTYMTPGEVVERQLYHTKKKGLPTDDILEILEDRAGFGNTFSPETAFSRYYCKSYIEGPGGEGIVELFREHTVPNDEATADNLAISSRAAADYIVRIIGEDGRHNYRYDAHKDRDARSYNMLRHCGTTYSLAQAYERFRDPAYKAACERSFAYLMTRTELREEAGHWGPNYRFILEDRMAKLGGSGLALVAMCQYTEATGDLRYLETMREFARFILKMQDQESGKLISYFDYGPTAEVPEEDSIYYPGEALYGLGKFYFIDPDPKWLDAANKGAYWLIFDRDADKKPLSLPHDHWLMMALSYLYAHTEDPAYKEHCMNIGRAIENKFRGPDHDWVEDYPDYLGTYYRTARVTPVACRVEGTVGGVDLCKLAGDDYEWLLRIAQTSAGFSMTLQFDPVNSFYLRNPRKALGGLKEGIYENAIRNDYVQHNLSGFIGVERHLRAQDGIELPGGPAWSRKVNAEGIVFQGYPAPGSGEVFHYPGEPLYHIPYTGNAHDEFDWPLDPWPPTPQSAAQEAEAEAAAMAERAEAAAGVETDEDEDEYGDEEAGE